MNINQPDLDLPTDGLLIGMLITANWFLVIPHTASMHISPRHGAPPPLLSVNIYDELHEAGDSTNLLHQRLRLVR